MPENLAAWIRSLRAEADGNGDVSLHERVQRATFPGFGVPEVEGPFLIGPAGSTFQPLGRYPLTPAAIQWLQAGNGGGQELDSMPASLGALLSLVWDRRIEVVPEAAVKYADMNETIFFAYSDAIDRRLTSPVAMADAPAVLEYTVRLIEGLNEIDADVIARASSLHYAAVLTFDADVDAAYSLVVAGIETLSRAFGEPPSDWSDWEDSASWDEFMGEIALSEAQQTAVRDRLLKDRHLRLKRTFVEYVISRLDDDFWSTSWLEFVYELERGQPGYTGGSWSDEKKLVDYLSRDEAELRVALSLAYDHRSGYVHGGKRATSLMGHLSWAIPIRERRSGGRHGLPFALARTILRFLALREMQLRSSLPDELPVRHLRTDPTVPDPTS